MRLTASAHSSDVFDRIERLLCAHSRPQASAKISLYTINVKYIYFRLLETSIKEELLLMLPHYNPPCP